MGGNSSHLEEPSNSSSESYQKTKERLEQLKEAERWQRLLEEERQRKEAELRKLLEEERQLKEAHRQQRLLEQERQRKEAEALRKLLEEERQWKKVDRQQRLLEEEHQRKEAERMRRLLEEQRQRIEEERQQRLLDEERYRIETERMRRILEEERQRMEAERQERLLKEELREKEEQHQKRLQERREKLLEEQRRRKFLQDGRRQEIYNEQILQKEKCQQTYIKKEQQKSSEEHQERSLDEESLKMFLKEEYQEKIPEEREQKHYMMGIMNLYTFAEGHMELSKAQGEHDTPVKPGFLHSAVLRDSLTANWDAMPPNKTYVRVPVREDTEEFRTVKNSFKSTTQKRFIVNKIERVQNPFLLGCYLLKKSEMQNMYGVRNVKENVLFRGAFEKFIDKNCEKNFNWRIFAVSKHNKLGEGLTLSPISYIANFCAEREATNKTMFLLRVLVSKVTEASENMEIPPLLNDKNFSNVLRFDTTGRRDGKMIVKFTDNEFYPNYIIHYTVGPELQKKGDKSENLNAP